MHAPFRLAQKIHGSIDLLTISTGAEDHGGLAAGVAVQHLEQLGVQKALKHEGVAAPSTAIGAACRRDDGGH